MTYGHQKLTSLASINNIKCTCMDDIFKVELCLTFGASRD